MSRMMDDVGGFQHFHHEGRLSGRNIVLRADAAEDTVDQANPRVIRWDERTDLSEEDDETALAQDAASGDAGSDFDNAGS